MRLLKFDAGSFEVLGELLEVAEVDGAHPYLFRAINEAFHVIDKDGLLGLETNLFQNAPVNAELRLSRPHLMGRKRLREMPQDLEFLFNVGKMKGVSIGNKEKRIMLFDPSEKLFHPGILPENIIPILFESFIRNRFFKNTGRGLIEFPR